MTVASETSRITATGITAGVPIAVNFPIHAVEDVTVYYGADEVATLSTHYSVTLNAPDYLTASVTPTSALVTLSGGTITIARRVAFVQTLNLPVNNRIPESGLARALDYLTFMAQQVRDDVLRVLKFPSSDAAANMSALPSATDRANKFFKFDANGLPTAVSVLTTGTVTFSAFGETMVALAAASNWRSTLDVPGLSVANSFAGVITFANAVNEKKWTDIAAATTTDLGAANGSWGDVTGSGATINSLGTAAVGIRRKVRFTGANTITHNGTSLIMPAAANFVTAAGDVLEFSSLGSGNWVCTGHQLASGKAITPPAGWEVIQSVAVTPGAAHTLDNIPSKYNWLRIRLDFIPVSDGVNLEFLARKGAGTNITSYTAQFVAGIDTTASAGGSSPNPVILHAAAQNDANVAGAFVVLEIANIQASHFKKAIATISGTDASFYNAIVRTFLIRDTAALTGFTLDFSGGNIASPSRILVEGCA